MGKQSKQRKRVPQTVIFYWPHNRPFRRDGDEFKRMAHEARDFYKIPLLPGAFGGVHMFEIPKISKMEKRQYVLQCLRNFPKKSIKRVLVFCHGSHKSIGNLGFNMGNIHTLGDVIYSRGTDDCAVVLYSCLTGRSEKGIANLLSSTSAKRVIAHKTRGHTVRNPFKRVFNEGKMADLWPHEKNARKRWVQTLKSAPADQVFELVEGFLNGK